MTTRLREFLSEASDEAAWKTATPQGRIVAGQLEQAHRAAQDVRVAIDRYQEAMQTIADLKGLSPKVLGLAKRGVATANREDEKWSGIQDDKFVIGNAMYQGFVAKGDLE